MTYHLKVNQQWKIALALIFCPIFFTLLYFWFIVAVKNIPDWMIWVSVIILIAASLASTLFIVFRWLTVDCEIRLHEQSFQFKLLHETPFMHIHDFSCNWENIKNASWNEDRQHGKVFYSIHFRNPGMTLYLMDIPKKNTSDKTVSEFWMELRQYIDRYNQSTNNPEMKIKDIGFYEKPWAKVFTYASIVLTVLFLLTSIFNPDGFSFWRIAAFCGFSIPWISNYYYAKRKRDNHPV